MYREIVGYSDFNVKLNIIMIRKNRKTRKYSAPSSKATSMALENNFCATVRFNVRVQELDNINYSKTGDDAEPTYFEF